MDNARARFEACIAVRQAVDVADRRPVCLQKVDELAEIAMTAHQQQGEHDKAVEAARLIRSVLRRQEKLHIHGYWKELADLTQVIHKPLPSLHTTFFLCCRT